MSRKISALLRKSDTISRRGGDEFVLLLPELSGIEDASKIARRIIEAVRNPFEHDGLTFKITTSIGIAIHPHDGKDANSLLKNADLALYHAKAKGRDKFKRYTYTEVEVCQRRE